MLNPRFEIQFSEEVEDFLQSLDFKSKEKIIYNLHKSRFVHDETLFKKLQDEIWEFRTFFKSKSYRLFAFWDKSDSQHILVIATHGIIKKTNKIPRLEIERSKRFRTQYVNQKKK